MLYILNCQDKYNWEQQGNEEKDRQTEIHRQKAGGLSSSWRSLSTPTQHGFEQRGRILQTAEQEIKVITYR